MVTSEKDVRRFIGEIAKPTSGEEAERIKLACEEYLRNPQRNSLRDFSDFAGHMLRLSVRFVRKDENFKGAERQYTMRPFTSLKELDGTSIEISQTIIGKHKPNSDNRDTTITTTSRDCYKEELSVTLRYANASGIVLKIDPSESSTPLELGSHMIGKVKFQNAYQMGVSLSPNPEMLQGIKGLAQRIWNAYERQNQKAPAPQP